ncbi:MAG: alpha/beta fold hydrolase [archaeon]
MTDPATEMYRTRADALSVEAGSGPELLCAHGTLMDRTMFAPQIEAFSDEYRVASYDLRARTERYGTAYDLDELVEDCLAVIDGLDMDRPVLAGMSMGGFMALRLAIEYPDRISGLVLVDSISEPHPDEEIALYGGMIDDVRDAESVPRELAETVTQFLFGGTTLEERPDLVSTWVDRWITYPGESVYNEVSSWLHRDDVTEELESVDVPALAVHGEEDASLSPEQAQSMVDALDARLELIPEAGHSSNLENPRAVNEAIGSFLESVYD